MIVQFEKTIFTDPKIMGVIERESVLKSTNQTDVHKVVLFLIFSQTIAKDLKIHV